MKKKEYVLFKTLFKSFYLENPFLQWSEGMSLLSPHALKSQNFQHPSYAACPLSESRALIKIDHQFQTREQNSDDIAKYALETSQTLLTFDLSQVSIRPSVRLSARPSTHPPTHPSIHPYIPSM